MTSSPEISDGFVISQNPIEERPHHNCGVAAVCCHSGDTSQTAFITAAMLNHLQHRGPDGAGVAVFDTTSGYSYGYSDLGSVQKVLTRSNLSGLGSGEYSIGQVRYPTQGAAGHEGRKALQPIHKVGQNGEHFWTAHNGQFSGGIGEFASDTDKLSDDISTRLVGRTALEAAVVKSLAEKPDSAYSLVFMSKNGVLAFRDPDGRHPLYYGYSEALDSHVVASESPALQNVGVSIPISLDPGYALKLERGKTPAVEPFVDVPQEPKLCALEAIYFARADGKLENQEIYEMRRNMGARLAQKDSESGGIQADVVIPVPDSARAAALGYAQASGLSLEEGFIKTTSDRSFLQPTQAEREATADRKLQIIPSQVRGKNIILVEDSIVRGTTLRGIVSRLKKFGANEVHLRIASPPIMWECTYGIDIPTRDELIAYREGGDVDKIREKLGAESLVYLDIQDLRAAIGGRLGTNACGACFMGRIPRRNFNYKIPFVAHTREALPALLR